MIRRDGSPDECNPMCDADRLPELPEDWPRCDAGHSGCTGAAVKVRMVPYLKEPLHLCDACDAVEQRKIDDGPSDDDQANRNQMEGGIAYGPEWRDNVNWSRR